ncbi:UMP-CMP kinase isoform X2 [Moschus berezovskii]|nr:UMP-CMP kinase isoform X2 [Moschus berezovskii]
MSPERGGEDSCAANERAAEAPPLPASARTPRQPPRRGRGWRRLGPPPSPRPAPRQRRPGCCQLSQRPTQPRCMLSRCGRRLLHVLGLSFPLLTGQPLFPFPHRFMKPQVVFVLGGPGAGKGTQCARIVEKYGYTHLSAGELLRDERKNPDSQYGELIEKYIKDGKIVPVEITISLLRREMDQTMAASAQKNKFLIDGFPRNQDNLQGWNKTMDGKADVSFVLFFDCNNEICIERCLERGKSSGRSDDNRESLEKRIQTYLQSTKPIIDLYEEMGKVKKIDASKSVDEVFDEVVKIFDKEG